MKKSTKSHIRWKNVRIKEQTYNRLVKAIEEIEAGVEAGRLADPGILAESINPATRGLSFDQLIALLLDRRDAHKERAKKSARKQRES